MKWITLKEFRYLKIQSGNELEKAIELSDRVKGWYPCSVMVGISEADGKKYFEGAEVRLKHDEINIRIAYNEYTKKYRIYADMRDHFKNIDQYTLNELQKNMTPPNKIGVLSAKKILEWVNYWEALYSKAYNEDQENGSEKANFLESIKGLPVEWSPDKKSGWIRKNGLQFSFTIGDTYVSKRMEVHYGVPTSIEVFKLIADNRYKAKID